MNVRVWLGFVATMCLSCALERDAVTPMDATVSEMDGSWDGSSVMDVIIRDVRLDAPRDRAQDEPSDATTAPVDAILMADADAVDVVVSDAVDVASAADADVASSPDAVSDAMDDAVSPDVQDATAVMDVATSPDVATTDTRPDVPQDVRPETSADTGSGMDVVMTSDVVTDTGLDVRPDVPDVVTDTGPDAPAPFVCPVTRLCVEYDATGMPVPVNVSFRLTPSGVGVPGLWTTPCNMMLDHPAGTGLYRCMHDADPFPAQQIVLINYVSAGDVGFCTSTGCPGIPDRLRFWSHGVPTSGASAFMPTRAALNPARPSVLSWVIQFIPN